MAEPVKIGLTMTVHTYPQALKDRLWPGVVRELATIEKTTNLTFGAAMGASVLFRVERSLPLSGSIYSMCKAAVAVYEGIASTRDQSWENPF